MIDSFGGIFVRKGQKPDDGDDLPRVDVAAVLIMQEGRILAVFNEKWNCFTLPMTKRAPDESWDAAARRAAREWIPSPEETAFLMDLAEFVASRRDEETRRYHVRLYKADLEEDAVPTGPRAEWWSAQWFVRHGKTEVSPTAEHIVQALLENAWNLGLTFA